MIRCIIVDDKPLAIDLLKDYIAKLSFLDLVLSTVNPLEALDTVMRGEAELVFLDIQMPQLNGIQFMKIAQGKCKVILITAYSKYAVEGFENDAIDYLLKPVSFERFYKAVQKAKLQFEQIHTSAIEGANSRKDYIFVKTEYKLVKIDTDAILYIEGLQNYVSIYTKSEKIISLQNIKKMEGQLSEKQFIRVHKSYIVAINKIESIERSRLFIGAAIIPLGDSFRDVFFKAIS